MLRITGVNVPLNFNFNTLTPLIAKQMRLKPDQIRSAQLIKKSVDARRKNDIHFVLSVDVALKPGVHFSPAMLAHGMQASEVSPAPYAYPQISHYSGERPLVVGLGPAGLFAALTLARCGMRPIVIERGRDVDSRMRDVSAFWQSGALDPHCNVQFGEGGAGAFSDGKLTTGISDPRCREVLETLCEAGAPEEILYEAKPHIGTDRLPSTVRAIREKIRLLGGDVYFEHELTQIGIADERVVSALIEKPDGQPMELPVRDIILAVGHSARDTFEMLNGAGVRMIQKPFSIGVRIEHSQEFINRTQYGAFAGHPALGAAEYKLNARLRNGRNVYTFCMCPGGEVVAAASFIGGVVTNGMSAFARAGKNANSALLVNVDPEDFGSAHPLAGIYFQEKWERLAFEAGGSDYCAPAQLVGDFLKRSPSVSAADIEPTYRPGVRFGTLDVCLPAFACESLREGLLALDKKLPGFAAPGAVLTGVETRSSSPIRIPRGNECSANIAGLYPCGEGAGYAGGIMSAAVDGIRCAEALMQKYQ